MKTVNRGFFAILVVLTVLVAPPLRAQTQATKSQDKAATSAGEKQNLDAYIALMRRDVRQEKAEIMGAMMELNAQDSTKFWPIYSDYDSQLAKLNDQRVANIKEYAKYYDNLTDDQADKLVHNAMDYQKQRQELLGQTYEKVKAALGGVVAARFLMVEHQILTIIELQIISSLPVAGQSM